jgi:hypothetical protein
MGTKGAAETIVVAGREVLVSNPHKVLFSGAGTRSSISFGTTSRWRGER